MGTLSANTLFHFTKNMDNLINILKTDFQPSYCQENFYLDNRKRWKVPMVCFCDIPLSQIKAHTLRYGEYAIGMTKEWAIKNNVNPVLYTNESVELVNTIRNNYNLLAQKRDTESIDGIRSIIDNLLYQHAYIKPYEEIIPNETQSEHTIKRYYDEREWRYIPPRHKFDEISIDMFQYTNESVIPGGFNSYIRTGFSLDFKPKDINYIIVSKENEILAIKEQVEEIKGDFDPNDVKLLSTRIISMERIKEDF